VLAALALGLATLSAHAHKPSDSYLAVESEAGEIRGQWDIALRDLEYAIGIDANGDGAITWGELRAKHTEIAAYALARLVLRADARPCELKPTKHLVDEHTDGKYAVLRFGAECGAGSVRELEVEYKLFADLDPTHRGLLRARIGSDVVTAVLGPDQPRLALRAEGRSRWAQFLDYGREGIWHIGIGIDHVLFLLSLLLPAVFARSAHSWSPAARFAPVFWDVFRVVTAFTVAHSITLSLAALAVIELPSRLVESAIAFSVVVAALNNLWPLVHRGRWLVAFGFGLVHGFGFASVLTDLGLEAGQLLIVAAFLPLAYWLRSTWAYRRMIFAGGSAAIAFVAAVWMAERAFNLKLAPI
jgi:hypothetical protein